MNFVPRRDKDTRRTVNSVRDHQKTMEAFGRILERPPLPQEVQEEVLRPHVITGDGRKKFWNSERTLARGAGHVITGDGRIGTRGVNEFSRPTVLNKEKLDRRSEYYKDVYGFDPADDYKAPKKKDK